MDWRKRMLVIFMPLFALCLVFSLVMSYSILSKQIAERSLQDNQNVVQQIRVQVETVFKDVELFCTMICTDKNINTLLAQQPETVSQQTDTRYSVMEHLRTYSYLCQYVDTFVIERADGEIFTSVRGFEQDYQSLLQENWYRDFLASGANGAFSAKHMFFTPYGSKMVEGVSYILRYQPEHEKAQQYNHVIAEIRFQTFEKMLKAYTSHHGSIYLLDAEGLPLGETPPEGFYQGTALETGYDDEGRYIFTTARMEKPNWTIVLALDRYAMNQDVWRELQGYALVEGAIFLLLTVVAAGFIFQKSKPIGELTRAVQAIAKGELSTRVHLSTHDELEALGRHINTMAEELQRYINAAVKAEADKRQAQMDLLMAQIRPHFIYNTLNSITYLIEENRPQEAITSTNALITLLQDTVHFCQTDTMNTLESEGRILQHYLTIQAVRYPEAFDYAPSLPENAGQLLVPRMLLQPLVENALLHGIVPKGKKCTLRVEARVEGNSLLLAVADNGVGMTEEQLKNCLAYHESNGMRGIAMSNIVERLERTYGPGGYCFDVESTWMQGTCVRVQLPRQCKEISR